MTQGWLHRRPPEFSRARALRTDFLQFFSGGGVAPGKFKRISSTAAIALFALLAAAFAWRSRLRMFNGGRFLLILWFVVVCAAPTVMDLLQHTYAANIPRYTLAALPAAYLLAALGSSLLSRRVALILLTLILFCWLMPISNIYRLRARSGEPFRDVARELSTNASSSGFDPGSLNSLRRGRSRALCRRLCADCVVGPTTRHAPGARIFACARRRTHLDPLCEDSSAERAGAGGGLVTCERHHFQ